MEFEFDHNFRSWRLKIQIDPFRELEPKAKVRVVCNFLDVLMKFWGVYRTGSIDAMLKFIWDIKMDVAIAH